MIIYRKRKNSTTSHIFFTILFLNMLLFGVSTGSAQEKQKPNVLFIISDDLTTTALGDTDVATPKIAEMMKKYY